MENATQETAAAEQVPDPAPRYQGLVVGPGGEMSDPPPRFAGRSIDLGGKVYIIPGLSLRQLKELGPKLDALAALTEDTLAGEYFDTTISIILPAIQRNYPSMTRDELEGVLDLNNVGAVSRAATGQRELPDPAAP